MTVKLSAQAHNALLLKVATKTRSEARSAWRQARAHPNEKTLRSAFRACVLASRSSHRAAKAWSHDSLFTHRLIAAAKKLDVAAAEFKAQLVETLESNQPPAT